MNKKGELISLSITIVAFLVLSASILLVNQFPEMKFDITGMAVAGAACVAGMSGSNTTGDPCLITNCTELQNMNLDLNGHFALDSDIDCNVSPYNTGAGFNPIGCAFNFCGTRSINTPFTGTFNGNNHKISNLFINRASENNVGIFGYTSCANIINV